MNQVYKAYNRMTLAADFDPAALLSKPLSDIKRPPPMATGSFVAIATNKEFGKTKPQDGSEGTPFVSFEETLQEALPDVDADALKLALDGNPLSERKLKLDFYLTPNAVYRLKEFGENHCGVAESDAANLGELIELILGRPHVVVLSQQANKKDPEHPYVNITSTAAVPE